MLEPYDQGQVRLILPEEMVDLWGRAEGRLDLWLNVEVGKMRGMEGERVEGLHEV